MINSRNHAGPRSQTDPLSFGGSLRRIAEKSVLAIEERLTADGRRQRAARQELEGIKVTASGVIRADISRRLRHDPVVLQGQAQSVLEDYILRQINAVNGDGGFWYRLCDRTGFLPLHSRAPLPADAVVKGNLKYFPNRDPYLEVSFSEDLAFLNSLKDRPPRLEAFGAKLTSGINALREELTADPRAGFEASQDAIERKALDQYLERKARRIK